MKKIPALLLFLFWAATSLFAQSSLSGFSKDAFTKQYPLFVNERQTTILLFPARIADGGVDRGSADIIAKTVDGVANVLKLKAVKSNIQPTNLTVITTDGKVYSFRVRYSADADCRPIDLRKQLTEEKAAALFNNRRLNDAQIDATAKHITTRKPFLHHPKARSFKVIARLEGIYTVKDVVFYRLKLTNKTQIDYLADFIRFYVRDQKRIKRTAQQELVLNPLEIYYTHGNLTAGKTSQDIVIAFPRFTIADHKDFVVQIFEKGGDRNLELKINGNDIIKARQIPAITD